jgi:hypothetical protein
MVIVILISCVVVLKMVLVTMLSQFMIMYGDWHNCLNDKTPAYNAGVLCFHIILCGPCGVYAHVACLSGVVHHGYACT